MEKASIRARFGIFRMSIIHSILRFVPKEKGLVLCNAWFGQKYTDNPKFVFEYLLENSEYKVIWVTKNKTVYVELHKQGKPVVMKNSLLGLIKQIRAQAVFSTVQFSDYNQWLLTNTIYIDLQHGHPIKDPGVNVKNEPTLSLQKHFITNLNYYAIVSSEFSRDKYQDVVSMDPANIFISNFARNDVFSDETLRIGKNEIVTNLKGNKKAIVYMPTHRSDGHNTMNMEKILPLDEIQAFCIKNGYVFFIKKHFYHRNETEQFENYSRIFDITREDSIDPQVLLFQADVLISDYSACYIDFLLLNRPLMFYHFDIEEFLARERSFYIPFETIDIAPIAFSKKTFITNLSLSCSTNDVYKEKRELFSHLYFTNMIQGDGRKKVKEILDKLMNKHYSL